MIRLTGASGLSIDLQPFQIGHVAWNDVPGVYAFWSVGGLLTGATVYYVGQCQSFRERHAAHHKHAAAVRAGATHILALRLDDAAVRDFWEADLYEAYLPSLNDIRPPSSQVRMIAAALSKSRFGTC